MDLNNFKMIVSDLDGTLVPFGSDDLSILTEEAINLLRDSNIIFTVATGRSWKQAKKLTSRMKVNVPVIIQSGALIIDPQTETIIRAQNLRSSLNYALESITTKLTVDQLFLGNDGIYYGNQLTTQSGNWLLQSGEKCVISEQAVGSQPVVKQLFIGLENDLRQITDRIRRQIRPLPNMILWPPDLVTENWFLEVFDPLASKGQALGWLVNDLHLQMEEVIAFGDGFNDIDMLQRAGLGIAMDNAAAEIRNAAVQCIPGPESDGLAQFIINRINCRSESA